MTFLPVWRSRNSPGSKGGSICDDDPRVRGSNRAAGLGESTVPSRGVHCARSGNYRLQYAFMWRLLAGQGKHSIYSTCLSIQFYGTTTCISIACFTQSLL